MKTGQVTIFIILGLLVIIIFGVALYFRNTSIESKLSQNMGVSQILESQAWFINKSMRECLYKSIENDTLVIGGQSQVTFLENYITYLGNTVGYSCWKFPNKPNCVDTNPIKSIVEDRLSTVLSGHTYICINKMDLSNDNKFELNKGDFSLKSNINEKNIKINISYPISLRFNGLSTNISGFIETIDMPNNQVSYLIKK